MKAKTQPAHCHHSQLLRPPRMREGKWSEMTYVTILTDCHTIGDRTNRRQTCGAEYWLPIRDPRSLYRFPNDRRDLSSDIESLAEDYCGATGIRGCRIRNQHPPARQVNW
jgi:hypothetical protein